MLSRHKCILSRYQVRVRRQEDVHTFALRLNAVRNVVPDPKAMRYRAALHLAIVRGPVYGQRPRQTAAAMIGAIDRA